MKFELPSLTSDEAVLRLSAAASGVAAAHYGLTPRQAHDTFWAPVSAAAAGQKGAARVAAGAAAAAARRGCPRLKGLLLPRSTCSSPPTLVIAEHALL